MSQTLIMYREFLETIPDAALVVDHTGTIVCANEHLAGLFHTSADQLLNEDFQQIIPHNKRAAHAGHFRHYWQTPKRRSMGAGGTFSALRPDNSEFPVDIMLTPVDLDGSTHVLCVIRDRTDAWAQELALRDALKREQTLALTDSLTGCANLRHLLLILQRAIDDLHRHQRPFTLVYFDLDNFKAVNDRHGHEEGDRVLRQFTQRIQSQLRSNDLLARLGGDEFAILMPETEISQVRERIETLLGDLDALARRKDWLLSLSSGVLTFDRSPETPENALRLADTMMYQVKRQGKNGALFSNYTTLHEVLKSEQPAKRTP